MRSSLLTYRLPCAHWSLRFSEAAIAVLGKHAQRRRFSRETVGQLYTRDLLTNDIVVDEATALSPLSASWAAVRFDIKHVAAEREAMFSRGLHCIGLWHTHPEPRPSPSLADRTLARDHALAARPQLAGLIFAILGTQSLPTGLRVWVDDGSALQETDIVLSSGSEAKQPGRTRG